MLKASVIIPTYGRAAKLEGCLAALRRQRLTSGDALEVLVAEDGALNAGESVVASSEAGVTRIRLPRVGVSAARNAAIERASGELLLFINDDCYPDDNWASRHIAAHRTGGGASLVVGRTDWQTWPDPTIFDGLLRDTSMIFFYDRMRDGATYGFRHFWTCNASVATSLARDVGGFDERIRPVFFDDVEFAWRVLEREGGGVRYDASARCVHDHRLDWPDYLKRERTLGGMAALLARVNRSCFRAIFGSDDPASLCGEFERWLQVDVGDHERIERELSARVRDTLIEDATWGRLCQKLYAAHLPVKRRAFREGFVAAWLGLPTESVDMTSIAGRGEAPEADRAAVGAVERP